MRQHEVFPARNEFRKQKAASRAHEYPSAYPSLSTICGSLSVIKCETRPEKCAAIMPANRAKRSTVPRSCQPPVFLQRLRQLPVIERHPRRNAVCKAAVHHAVIVLESSLVPPAVAVRVECAPSSWKSGTHAARATPKPDVLREPMVAVAGDRAVISVCDRGQACGKKRPKRSPRRRPRTGSPRSDRRLTPHPRRNPPETPSQPPRTTRTETTLPGAAGAIRFPVLPHAVHIQLPHAVLRAVRIFDRDAVLRAAEAPRQCQVRPFRRDARVDPQPVQLRLHTENGLRDRHERPCGCAGQPAVFGLAERRRVLARDHLAVDIRLRAVDLTDGFQIGRADLPVGLKRACAVPQDGLRAGDPGIVVTENPRVFLCIQADTS